MNHVRSRLSAFRQKLLILLAVLAMMVSALSQVAYADESEIGTKQTTSRSIAIVYDNSGSMFAGKTAWAQATYAMEVFASMANETDEVRIYPMNPVTIGEGGSKQYNYDDPVVIAGGGDTSAVRQMYSLNTLGDDTPLEAVKAAYSGLKDMPGDEKWLIVLTDGAEFYENGEKLSAADTKTRLTEEFTSYVNDVNVMYLGIGDVQSPEVATSKGSMIYYANNASMASGDILTKLTSMSNMIFGRSTLPDAHKNGNDIDFDLKMSKLIVFVQGDGISDLSLTGSSGTLDPVTEYSPRYSEKGTDKNYSTGVPTDESLSGMIAIYENVEDGNYSISYSGDAKSLEVYYEPMVYLQATLEDESGTTVTDFESVHPGNYNLHYGLYDTDNNETSSDLLGSKNFDITYYVDGQEYTDSSTENGTIPLAFEEGTTIEGKIAASYLDGYELETDSRDWGWPEGGIVVTIPDKEFESKLTDSDKYYQLGSISKGSTIVDTIKLNGEPMSDDLIQQTELAVSINGETAEEGTDYTVDRTLGNGQVGIQLQETDKLQKGDNKISVTAKGYNEYGQEVGPDTDDIKISCHNLPAWVRNLIILLALLLLALLIWFISNQKVLPKDIRDNNGSEFKVGTKTIAGKATYKYEGKGKNIGKLSITSPRCPFNSNAKCGVTFDLKAASPRRTRSAQREAVITKMSVANKMNITSVQIGAAEYTRDKAGNFVKSGATAASAKAPMNVTVRNNSTITIVGKAETDSGGKQTFILNQKLKFK